MAKAAKNDEVMVVNDQSRLVFFPGKTLRPGVNSVPVAVAEAMKKNPSMQKLKSITISDAPRATKGLDIPEAEELVEKTNDDELLHKYQSEDGRPAVAKAIVEQRAKLTPSDKKDD